MLDVYINIGSFILLLYEKQINNILLDNKYNYEYLVKIYKKIDKNKSHSEKYNYVLSKYLKIFNNKKKYNKNVLNLIINNIKNIIFYKIKKNNICNIIKKYKIKKNNNNNIQNLFDKYVKHKKYTNYKNKKCIDYKNRKFIEEKHDGIENLKIKKMLSIMIKYFYIMKCSILLYQENTNKFLDKFIIFNPENKIDYIDCISYNTILKNLYEKINNIIHELKTIVLSELNIKSFRVLKKKPKICEIFSMNIKDINNGVYIEFNKTKMCFSYLDENILCDKMIHKLNGELCKLPRILKLISANVFVIHQDIQNINNIENSFNNINLDNFDCY